jgi:hypothetical protein
LRLAKQKLLEKFSNTDSSEAAAAGEAQQNLALQ